jgi:hypothetical protein
MPQEDSVVSLRTVLGACQLKFIQFSIVAVIAVGSASASVVGIYGAVDPGTGPGGPWPNSTAAEAAFWAALSVSSPTITFEGVTNLTSLGSGVSASIINGDPMSGLETINQHVPEPLGFNVTPGGNEWLLVAPNKNDGVGASLLLNFSSAINAFGLWIIDSQSDFPGPITITFNDGAAETLNVPKDGLDLSGNSTGGAAYYGFITNSPFTSLEINTGATTDIRDVWGVDNITLGTAADVPTPEPSTLSLLACATLLAICLKFRGTDLRCALRIGRDRN